MHASLTEPTVQTQKTNRPSKTQKKDPKEEKIMETHLKRPPPRRTFATTIPPASPPTLLEEEQNLLIVKPASLLIELIVFQVELISNCLLSIAASFISFLSAFSSESLHEVEEARNTAEDVVHAAIGVPSRVTSGCGILLRKLGFGLLGAAYVCFLLLILLAFAIFIGVGLVRLWTEEPVFVREHLHFDYTDVHPSAVYSFGDGMQGKRKTTIPSGHAFHVSVVLVMPESDFNLRIGVFQLTAEVISTTGGIIAKSSQPCMLRYRSLPIRLLRTCVMCIPILLGYSTETQRITMGLLKHKEGKPKTEAIRITLTPRAGTTFAPELYMAEIVLKSHLPPGKEIVYNWKFTFYVWVSLSAYTMLIILVCSFKRFVFPTLTVTGYSNQNQRYQFIGVDMDLQPRIGRDGEVLDTSRKWQRSRRRQQLFTQRMVLPETAGSSASSTTVTREDMSEVIDDSGGLADSESMCLDG